MDIYSRPSVLRLLPPRSLAKKHSNEIDLRAVTKGLFPMKQGFVICLLVALVTAVPALAQNPQAKPEPQTKMERFQARTGAVLIKNFSEIGSLPGLGGTASATSWEFIDAQTAKKEYGISIEVKESSRLAREDRAFIDYDEIDSLLKGIDYISTVKKGKLHNFQADYKTTGDLKVSVFDEADGTTQAAVSVGRISAVSVYYDIATFGAFRKMIVDAKAAIDAIKSTP